MAQLVARLHGMQKVRGSNPRSSTFLRSSDSAPGAWPIVSMMAPGRASTEKATGEAGASGSLVTFLRPV